MRTISSAWPGFALMFLVAGCGGSGDDDSSAPPPPPAPPAAPVAPTGVSTDAGDGEVTLTWTVAADADSYDLYWATTPAQPLDASTRVAGVTPPYTHTGITNGTTYYYRLVAVNAGGDSPPSAEVSATAAPDIELTVVRPHVLDLVGAELGAQVRVSASFEVVSVVARVEDRQGNLTFVPPGCDVDSFCDGWTGGVAMDGLSRGELTLSVTATDVNGSVTEESLAILHDEPPQATFETPVDYDLARPSIHVVATCADDDPAGCASMKLWIGPGRDELLIDAPGGRIDTDLLLADYDGEDRPLEVRGFDSSDQSSGSDFVHVLVESSDRLVEVGRVDDGHLITDVDPSRILFGTDTSFTSATLTIRDRATLTDTVVFDAADARLGFSFLTPFGAIFLADGPGSPSGFVSVFESGDGSLEELAQIHEANGSLDVAGGYATWTDRVADLGDLTRRDMRNRTNVLLSSAANLSDVAADGDVVYAVVEDVGAIRYTDIFRYEEGGVTTRLTDDADQSNGAPLTDGATVLYLKTPSSCCDYSLVMNDGVTEEVLASGTDSTDFNFSYAIENGWIAYTDDGPSGQFQVWVRAPDGTTTQVSAFNDHSVLQALGPEGELAFASGSRRYVSFPPHDSVEEISSDLTVGPILWQDGTLLVVLSKTLVQFVP